MGQVLFGKAAVAATGKAATGGLFGTAGKFALAQTLTTVGTTLAVGGQIQAGRATEAQMISAQRMADYNARLKEREAKIKRQETGFAQRQQAKRAARVKSALIARLGAVGGIGSPVAADLAAAQARELELESAMIGYMGETAAMRAESQAELDRLQGRIYKKRGKAARRASYYRAGASLLTGFGSTI